MRIGLLAPPWVPVPPVAYGGIEAVVDQLARGFIDAGHDVMLWTTGASTCPVPTGFVLDDVHPDLMGNGVLEIRHTLAGYEALAGWGPDVIHDHSLVGPILSAQYPSIPVVTTNHGPFTEDLSCLYRSVTPRVGLISISRDQAASAGKDISVSQVIHHGLDTDFYHYGPGTGDGDGDYFLFLGRMAADKGVLQAVQAVRANEGRLIIAAKMREPGEKRYFADHIEPLLDDRIRYIGEADQNEKVELLAGATALVNPIQWSEPFGLVMIEALACGTPVLTSPIGSAPELIEDGVTGFLCADQDALVEAVGRADQLDRRFCRAVVLDRFSTKRMVEAHIDLFERLISAHGAEIDTELITTIDESVDEVLTV